MASIVARCLFVLHSLIANRQSPIANRPSPIAQCTLLVRWLCRCADVPMYRCTDVPMYRCADVQAPRRPEFDGPSRTSKVRGGSDSRPQWGDRTPMSPCPARPCHAMPCHAPPCPALPCRAMRRFMPDFPINLMGHAWCEIRQNCTSSAVTYLPTAFAPTLPLQFLASLACLLPYFPDHLSRRTPILRIFHASSPPVATYCPVKSSALHRHSLKSARGLPSKGHYPEAFG
jgi:hypothetical protein